MSKRRRRSDEKAGLFGLALLGVGVIEALEACDEGENVLEAAGKAMRRTKSRAKILAETEQRLALEEKRRGRTRP